jgi:hypothetical protein
MPPRGCLTKSGMTGIIGGWPEERNGRFARAFIEGGALAWPNGFELSADALHKRLEASGALVRDAA